MKPIAYTIAAFAMGAMVLFMFFVQFLIYGISRDFGLGVGVGVGLSVIMFYLGSKAEKTEKQEILPPKPY